MEEEKTLQELSREIINEIEREDFIYAIKHYGCYKVKTTAKEIRKWCENV